MKRFLLRILTALLLLLTLAGCMPTAMVSIPLIEATALPQPDSARPPGQLKVALVMKTLTNPVFTEMEKGARQAERELGIELIVKTAAQETSIEQQVEILDELVQARVDAIVIAPADSTRVIPALQKAQDAGIALVNIDNPINTDIAGKLGLIPVPFIGPDNQDAAYRVVKEMTQGITKPAHAAIITGVQEAHNSSDREQGALRAFKENPQINVTVTKSADWKIDEAYQVAQEIFIEDPQVQLIYCANDMMALGVVEYLKDTGRQNVLVAGTDGIDEAIQAVRTGKMAATIDQEPDRQGYLGVKYAVKAIQRQWVPKVTRVDSYILAQQDVR